MRGGGGGGFIKRRMLQRFRVALSTVGSVKIKLLLCCFVAFVLVAFVSRSSWPLSHSLSMPPVSARRGMGKGYTIVMNTWKRYDLLKQSIAHYAKCSGVDSIHIVWSEPDPPSRALERFLNRIVESSSDPAVELKFDVNTEDSLNNRFKEIEGLKTDVVFSVDDDVIFPCSSVEFAFNVWQSAPDAMVGFVPRVHWKKGNMRSGDRYEYEYGGWWSVWWTGSYSMVLSKAAFFHKKYLSLYTYQMPASIRQYTTTNRNCEDIAMSFLVANATGAPPIWVKGKIFEIGSTGISSLGGHSEKRSECVNRFVGEYGRMPLITTSVKAVDSRKIWFW